MTNRSSETFHDELVRPGEAELPGVQGRPERYFDRFVVNLHPDDATDPSVIVGCGLHPVRDVVDGFAQLTRPGEQRNLRFATELSASDWSSCGPLHWEVSEPNTTWQIRLADNPIGLSFDLTWRARTPAWWGDVAVTNAGGETTSFAHLFQSGLVEGTLAIDGAERAVSGWYSQRDRSRGVRTMAGGQGLHIWYQAQFPDRSIGFLLVENRDGGRLLLEGAVMHTDGRLDEITDVAHDLVFDDALDLKSGLVQVRTASGAGYRVETDASAGGGYMAGAGYGGHHGTHVGRDHLEHDVYPLDGSVTQRTLDSSLTDRLCRFEWDGRPGSGIFEFALSRSPRYHYRPTLP